MAFNSEYALSSRAVPPSSLTWESDDEATHHAIIPTVKRGTRPTSRFVVISFVDSFMLLNILISFAFLLLIISFYKITEAKSIVF
jgi:hypothetical protein